MERQRDPSATVVVVSIRLLVVASIWTAACDSADEGGVCEQRNGSYSITFVETSGTCGPIPEQILPAVEQPTEVAAPCTGDIGYSMDNCDVTNTDITCPEDGVEAGATSVSNGVYHWSRDGSHGEGTVNMRFFAADGTVICQSAYDVEANEL